MNCLHKCVDPNFHHTDVLCVTDCQSSLLRNIWASYTHTYVYPYIHTFIHTTIHAYIHSPIWMHTDSFLRRAALCRVSGSQQNVDILWIMWILYFAGNNHACQLVCLMCVLMRGNNCTTFCDPFSTVFQECFFNYQRIALLCTLSSVVSLVLCLMGRLACACVLLLHANKQHSCTALESIWWMSKSFVLCSCIHKRKYNCGQKNGSTLLKIHCNSVTSIPVVSPLHPHLFIPLSPLSLAPPPFSLCFLWLALPLCYEFRVMMNQSFLSAAVQCIHHRSVSLSSVLTFRNQQVTQRTREIRKTLDPQKCKREKTWAWEEPREAKEEVRKGNNVRWTCLWRCIPSLCNIMAWGRLRAR